MPFLWLQDSSDSWVAHPLGGPELRFPIPLALGGAANRPDASVVIFRLAHKGGESWLLSVPCACGVRVNGCAVPLGLRVLRHRDEIVVAGGLRVFFSTERLPQVEPFPGPTGTCCARCKRAIEPGSEAVQCPQCRIWCHQSAAFGCFQYSLQCPLCDQPTALDGEYRFNPAML